jgi:hypothetical protein
MLCIAMQIKHLEKNSNISHRHCQYLFCNNIATSKYFIDSKIDYLQVFFTDDLKQQFT